MLYMCICLIIWSYHDCWKLCCVSMSLAHLCWMSVLSSLTGGFIYNSLEAWSSSGLKLQASAWILQPEFLLTKTSFLCVKMYSSVCDGVWWHERCLENTKHGTSVNAWTFPWDGVKIVFIVKYCRCTSFGGLLVYLVSSRESSTAGWMNQALPQFLTNTACHVEVTVVCFGLGFFFCDVKHVIFQALSYIDCACIWWAVLWLTGSWGHSCHQEEKRHGAEVGSRYLRQWGRRGRRGGGGRGGGGGGGGGRRGVNSSWKRQLRDRVERRRKRRMREREKETVFILLIVFWSHDPLARPMGLIEERHRAVVFGPEDWRRSSMLSEWVCERHLKCWAEFGERRDTLKGFIGGSRALVRSVLGMKGFY